MPYGLPDGSHTRMKVKKTYRLEQETIEELEKLCSDSGKSATEVIEGAIHDAIHVPDVERIGDGWAQTVAALTDQLAVKDDQIASLGRALEAAQETAKAAQALHAANVQERALESSEQKESRRWRWPWDRQISAAKPRWDRPRSSRRSLILNPYCTLIVDMRPCSGMDGCRVHHFE